MSKIAVFDTVGETYAYTFRNYLKLFAITWVPILIASIVTFYVVYNLLPESMAILRQQIAAGSAMPPSHPFAGTGMLRWVWLLDGAMLLLMVMLMVGITKEVLGVREGPRFVYLRFGAAELRLLAGLVGVILIVTIACVGASIIAGIVAGIAMASGGQPDSHAMMGVLIPVFIVIYAIGFYFVVRLAFFLAPVVVAEKRIGVGRSWELTSGNFWRIFAIGLFIWIPLIVGEVVLFGGMLWPAMSSALAALPRSVPAYMLALQQAETGMMPYLLGLSFVLSPIIYGLIITPAAFAYRAVKPAEPSA